MTSTLFSSTASSSASAPGVAPSNSLSRLVAIAAVVVGAGVLGIVVVQADALLVIVGLVLGVTLCVAVFRMPRLILPIVVYSMWFEGIGGKLSVGRMVAALVLVLVGARIMFFGERLRMPTPIAWVPPAAFIMWAWLSGLWSPKLGPWLNTTVSLVIGVAYFYAVFLEVESPAQLWKLMKQWVWAGAFVCALSVGLAVGTGAKDRVPGLSGGPNNFATYLSCAVPFLALYLAEAKGFRRLAVAGLFPLYGIALVYSGSRAGFIAAAVVALYVILTFPSSSKGGARARRAAVGLVVLCLGVFAAISLNPQRFSLISSAASDRGAGRFDIWNAGLRTLKEHWLFGLGMGQFREQSTTILQKVTGSSLDIGEYVARENSDTLDTHNQYLQLWLDIGIFGLSLYFVMIGTAMYTLIQRASQEWRQLVWAFVGVMIVVHISFMFSTQINQKFLWLVMGVAAALSSSPRVRGVSRRRSMVASGVNGHR